MEEIKYLQLPQLSLPGDITDKEFFFTGKANSGYTSYKINDPSIVDQVKNIFPDFLIAELEGVMLQVLDKNFNNFFHKDPRTIAINYIIDSGGNVSTILVDPIKIYKLEPYRWHWFNAKQTHGVSNITTVRRAISLSIKNEPSSKTLDWLLNNSV